MKVKFLGHASFLITSKDGLRIITDPYKPGCFDGGIKYAPINEEADIVTISHEHDDHNCTDIQGNPTFVRGAGKQEIKDITVNGTSVFHDTSGGKDRGKNTIFNMTIDGMNVVHLGDLGHPLSDQDVKEIGAVDILFIPVGGYFTIDASTADTIITKLNPKIVVPMHFKTEKCDFPIAAVNEFTKNKQVKEFDSEFEASKENLPETTTTYVLTPAK
jgi:L-ascorbate metabolism protein UlaG (beta-lactamase superfamily)